MSGKESKTEKPRKGDLIFDKLLGAIIKENVNLFKSLYRANLSFKHSQMMAVTSSLSEPCFSKILGDPKNKKPVKRKSYGFDDKFGKARQIQEFLAPTADLTPHILEDLDKRISRAGIPYYDITDLELLEDYSEVKDSCNRLACVQRTTEIVTLAVTLIGFLAVLIYFIWLDADHLFWALSLLVACGVYLVVSLITFIPYQILYKKTLKKLKSQNRLMRRLKQRGKAVRAVVSSWMIQKTLPEKNLIALSGPYGLTIWLIFLERSDYGTKKSILHQMNNQVFRPFKTGCDKELNKLLDFNAADLGPYLGYGQDGDSKAETITVTKESAKTDLKTNFL